MSVYSCPKWGKCMTHKAIVFLGFPMLNEYEVLRNIKDTC